MLKNICRSKRRLSVPSVTCSPKSSKGSAHNKSHIGPDEGGSQNLSMALMSSILWISGERPKGRLEISGCIY